MLCTFYLFLSFNLHFLYCTQSSDTQFSDNTAEQNQHVDGNGNKKNRKSSLSRANTLDGANEKTGKKASGMRNTSEKTLLLPFSDSEYLPGTYVSYLSLILTPGAIKIKSYLLFYVLLSFSKCLQIFLHQYLGSWSSL